MARICSYCSSDIQPHAPCLRIVHHAPYHNDADWFCYLCMWSEQVGAAFHFRPPELLPRPGAHKGRIPTSSLQLGTKDAEI